MFLGITFSDLLSIYNGNKLLQGRAAIYTISLFIAIMITLVRFYRQAEKNATDEQGSLMKKVINLLKPLLPFYIIVTLLPAMTTSIEYFISKIIENSGASRIETITDYDQHLLTLLVEKKEELLHLEIMARNTGLNIIKYISISSDISGVEFEIFIIKLLKRISTYLFSFAVGVYFLWLLVLEMFAPIASLGIIFKSEMGDMSKKWISNFIACHLFLLFLYLSNALSVGFYRLFSNDGYSVIITGIVFILFRVFLYRQSFNLANKVV